MASTINAKSTGSGSLESTADASGVLALQTGGVTAVTIDTSQNVGIGTTSPYSRLNLSGSSANYNNSASVTFNDTSGDSGARKWLVGNVTPVNYGSLVFAVSSTPTGDPTNTKMLIDSSGNVGIGNNSPTGKLTVSKSNGGNVSGAANAAIYLDQDESTIQGPGTYTNIRMGGNLTLASSGLTSLNTNNIERMRIDSSGNFTLNNSAPSTTAFGTKYYAGDANCYWGNFVNSTVTKNQFTFNNPNGEVGRVTTNGSATTYNTSSDYRLKENITPIVGALEKVSQLKPVNWTWKVDGSDGQGFIAHELQAIVPDCVTGEKDAVDDEGKPIYQGVDTSFLVATLTAAIQEQQTIINDLKARITALEGAK